MKYLGSLKGKDFISLGDFTSSEVEAILNTSIDLKKELMKGKKKFLLKNFKFTYIRID